MPYERHIKSCIIVMSRVCCYCRLFVSSLSLTIVLRSDPMVAAVLEKKVNDIAFLYHCGQEIDEYRFCYSYFNILKQNNFLKFSSINKINVVICQYYPPILETLTLVQEMLIA